MIVLSWSGGKDSAYALTTLRERGLPPELLLTTVSEDSGEITHHGVPGELLREQARAVGLPLVEIPIPREASDREYAARMRTAFSRPPLDRATAVAFGDLLLEDLRAYRERRLRDAGVEALFPLWKHDTAALARRIAATHTATIVVVDTATVDAALLGRRYDRELLADLPPGVDPCGENGEFHTFVSDGPCFSRPVEFALGSVRAEGRFARVVPEPA